VTECVILFREPHTGRIDGILDDNRDEFLVCDNRQQAEAHLETLEPGLAYQIVELDNRMSTPAMRAALHARDPAR
jgi:hypothetical protein